jgi:hypothetical protein
VTRLDGLTLLRLPPRTLGPGPHSKDDSATDPSPFWAAEALWEGVQPSLPYLVPLLVGLLILSAPMPGRGPGSRRRDPWRVFKYGVRRTVMARAGLRCEAAAFMFIGRCRAPAVEADHIYPWSKGGATVLSNGQALCKGHNQSKSNMTPPWWYVLLLERRRQKYFPVDAEARVHAGMTARDREARALSAERRRHRG